MSTRSHRGRPVITLLVAQAALFFALFAWLTGAAFTLGVEANHEYTDLQTRVRQASHLAGGTAAIGTIPNDSLSQITTDGQTEAETANRIAVLLADVGIRASAQSDYVATIIALGTAAVGSLIIARNRLTKLVDATDGVGALSVVATGTVGAVVTGTVVAAARSSLKGWIVFLAATIAIAAILGAWYRRTTYQRPGEQGGESRAQE